MVKISIIIPVFNGYSFIDNFFKNFFKIEKISDIEVIIVDNNSDKLFLNKLISKSKSFKNTEVYSYNEKKSSYAARNFGASKALGKILAFVDFDCVITDDYIKEILKIECQDNLLISGKVELYHLSNNIYEIFDKYAYLKQEEYFKNNYAATANLIISKYSFVELNGFKDFISGGDNEFCKRAISNKFQIIYNKKLIVKHPMRGSFDDHLKKSIRLGMGHGQIFLEKKQKNIKLMIFVIKNLIGFFIPLHQLKIFLKISLKEKLNFSSIVTLFYLCICVGSIQRFHIIKKTILS